MGGTYGCPKVRPAPRSAGTSSAVPSRRLIDATSTPARESEHRHRTPRVTAHAGLCGRDEQPARAPVATRRKRKEERQHSSSRRTIGALSGRLHGEHTHTDRRASLGEHGKLECRGARNSWRRRVNRRALAFISLSRGRRGRPPPRITYLPRSLAPMSRARGGASLSWAERRN